MAFKETPRALWKQNAVNLFICEWYLSMILKDIKIFSQNVHKNNFLINTVLEIQSFFNIIFIQELSWSFLHAILSSKNKEGEKLNKEGEELVGVPNHPNWVMFSRNLSQVNNSPGVITYINVRLSSLQFSLWKDIFNHRDVSCIFFQLWLSLLFN